VEEDFRSKKSFVANINIERLFSDRILALMNFDPLGRLHVILCKLLHDVRAYVRVLLLNSAYVNHSISLSSQVKIGEFSLTYDRTRNSVMIATL